MNMHILGTYKAGVIHPDQPLDLPDNTKVEVTVTPVNGAADSSRVSAASARPAAPEITVERLRDAIVRHAVSIGTLATDFSRADIYHDHD